MKSSSIIIKLGLFATILFFFNCCSNNNHSKSAQKIQFENIKIDTTCEKIFPNIPNSQIDIKLDIDLPNNKEKSLKQLLINSITGIDTIKNEKQNFDAYINNWVKEYKQNVSEYLNQDTSATNELPSYSKDIYKWTIQMKAHQFFYDDDFLCYNIQKNISLGRPASISNSFCNVDLKKMKILTLNDLFTEDGLKQLSNLIISKFTSNNKLNDSSKLEDIGFYSIDEIEPTKNFSLDENGITFYYKKGEISTSAIGEQTAFLTYKEISFCIKKGSVIFKYEE